MANQVHQSIPLSIYKPFENSILFYTVAVNTLFFHIMPTEKVGVNSRL